MLKYGKPAIESYFVKKDYCSVPVLQLGIKLIYHKYIFSSKFKELFF